VSGPGLACPGPLFCVRSLPDPVGWRVVVDGAVRLICAGWLPQDEVFGWRGAAGLGMSGVTGYCRLSIAVSRVSSTLPSHPERAGNGTRLFIRPRMLLLDRGGEGPAPAGKFAGDGDVGDDPAFVAGLELVPLVVQPVVALVAPAPGGLVGCLPAGAHVAAGVVVGPAVVPGGLDRQTAGMGVTGLGDPALGPGSAGGMLHGTRPRYAPIVEPVKRLQSPISTARPKAVSTEIPRKHISAWTTGA
jgi:hypothetical protein